MLLANAEDWARSHRCVEMASDAVIENGLSQRAHKALGYEVVCITGKDCEEQELAPICSPFVPLAKATCHC